jgi:hypothetical protein
MLKTQQPKECPATEVLDEVVLERITYLTDVQSYPDGLESGSETARALAGCMRAQK